MAEELQLQFISYILIWLGTMITTREKRGSVFN